jgi:mono/diheme cytochrome c family protein
MVEHPFARRRLHGMLRAGCALVAGFGGSFGLASARQAPAASGWIAIYRDANGLEAPVPVPSAAFSIGQGETFEPTIRPEGSSVRFEALVRLPREGTYRFGLEVEGGDATVLLQRSNELLQVCTASSDGVFRGDPVAFSGEMRVQVRFVRRGALAARLRTLWELETPEGRGGFELEPIPSSFAKVPEDRAELLAASQLELRGRLLLEQKGCTNCHAAGERGSQAVGKRAAPKLDGVGQRLNRDWLEAWIRDPSAMGPSGDMPAIFRADELERSDFQAVVGYLASANAGQGAGESESPANEELVLRQGRALYHSLGCVACHGPFVSAAVARDDPSLPAEVPKVDVPAPFGAIRGKWKPAALAEFLRDPLASHPDGRMPSFALSKAEADLLATYLLASLPEAHTSPATRSLPAPPAMGEVLSLTICASCHALEGFQNTKLAAPPLDQLDPAKGCLDPADRGTPRYPLSPPDRQALKVGIFTVRRACGARAPLDEVRRTLAELHCASCHELPAQGDGPGGLVEDLRAYFATRDERADLGDEGRIPPDLSGAGFKLTSGWLARVLLEGARARPYMAARMPQFGERAKALVEGLARREGLEPHSDRTPPPSSDELVLAGRELMGRSALACITCHSYKDAPPVGTPGPALTDFAERLRYEWYRAYMPDPSRYKPGTRMPSFANGARSSFPSLLEGDLRRQVDALWDCCSLGEFMPVPEGVERGRGLQIEVRDRPVVLRTFLESTGARGIAIGTPVGVHFAFDAQAVRMVEAWKGAFLDASGAWTGRGGSNLRGRGPVVWKAPEGPPLVLSGWPAAHGWPEQKLRFHGYRLDSSGDPTLLYEIDGVHVAERIRAEVAPRLRILRTFELDRAPSGPLLVNVGPLARPRFFGPSGEPLAVEAPAENSLLCAIPTGPAGQACTFTMEILP